VSRARRAVERLIGRIGRGRRELWIVDNGFDGDGLARPIGRDAPALTLEQLDRLPPNPERLLIELADEPPPELDARQELEP
jgi:hypothetical protein